MLEEPRPSPAVAPSIQTEGSLVDIEMVSVCFSSGPGCACETNIKDCVLLKGIAPGKRRGRKLCFGVLYINGMTSLK